MGERQRRLGQGAAPQSYAWVAPTYAVDEHGHAYNTPATTGDELWTNGAFDSDTTWTKGAGWSISGGKAVRTAPAAQSNLTQTPGAANRYDLYRVAYTISNRSAGSGLALVQGTGVGARKNTEGTHVAWSRLGQATTWGVQAEVNSAYQLDDASLLAVDMDTALAVLNVSNEEIARWGVAFETAPIDDAMMLVAHASAANSLYNSIVAPLFQHTDGSYRVRLFKVVDGIPSSTLGADETVAFVAGARLELWRVGTTYTVWYNGAATAATGTITDASIIANPYHGFCLLGTDARASGFWLNGRRVPFAL